MVYTITSDVNLRQFFSRIEGDEATVIFKEGIYFAGGTARDCLTVSVKNLTLVGEGNVVIYDNRGHMFNCFPAEGCFSSPAHTFLFTGRRLKVSNITFVNGCNMDYEYGGRLLPAAGAVITQAYAFGAWGCERVEVYNSSFLSMLDTFDLRNVKSFYAENCHTRGNNDFIAVADVTYHKNCTFSVLGSCPMWSAGRLSHVFDGCTFDVDIAEDCLNLTKRGGDMVLVNCTFRGTPSKLRMEIRPERESRYYLFGNSWNGAALPLEGHDENFVNLTPEQAATVSPQANLCLKLERPAPDALNVVGGSHGVELSCSPFIGATLSGSTIAIANNLVGRDMVGHVAVRRGFLQAIKYIALTGKKVGYPTVSRPLLAELRDGRVECSYRVEGEDCSRIEVSCGGAVIYRMAGGQSYPVQPFDVGRQLTFTLIAATPQTNPVRHSSATVRVEACPPRVTLGDMSALVLTNTWRLHAKTLQAKYLGEEVANFVRFERGGDNCFAYGEGTDGALGVSGLIPIERGAALICPHSRMTDDMHVCIQLTLEKKSGEGFGSANGQYLELLLGCDGHGNGAGLRIEREVCSDKGCFISLRSYSGYVNKLISPKVFSSAYSGNCSISASLKGGKLTASVGGVSLCADCPELPNGWVLRHTGTVGVGNRFVVTGICYSV